MRICANTEISLPWDNSSDSFYSQARNDDTNSTITNPEIIHIPQNQPIQLQHNPYQTLQPTPPKPSLVTTLTSWIISRQDPAHPIGPITTDIPVIIEIVLDNNPNLPQNPRTFYQPVLITAENNNHWGDPIIIPKPLNTFQIVSQNVNTLSMKQGYLQWKAASNALAECKVDTFALQETNVSWNKIHHQKIRQILHQLTGQVKIATSSSTEISTTSYQCGGTLQAVVGGWVSRAVDAGKDPSGLG